MAQRLLSNFNIVALENCTVDEARELRKRWDSSLCAGNVPSVECISKELSLFFVSEAELEMIKAGRDALDSVYDLLEQIANVGVNNPSIYENMNIQRIKTIIDEVPKALEMNEKLLRNLHSLQQGLCNNIYNSLSRLNGGKSEAALSVIGKEIYAMMSEILASRQNRFEYELLINEQQHEHMNSVIVQLKDGYIFHFSVVDEMNSESVAKFLDEKVPEDDRKLNDLLMERMIVVTNAVNAAYEANWKIVALLKRLFCIVKETVNRV